MSKRFLVGATVVALAAGVGAGGMAAAGATSTKAHAAGERLTINGSPFGASLVSSPNLQIKNGVIVAKVKAAGPDAIVLIGFDESAQVIQELVKQGIGPNAAS